MSTDLAPRTNGAALMEKVVVDGDLTNMDAKQRVAYYEQTCKSLGLNPLTQPFAYIKLNGKLTLYATRNCTDQLRALHGVSIQIVGRERQDDLFVVTARATLPDGRSDESTGAVSVGGLRGDALGNALMRCETKAKRRVTLSVVGLGWLDESEVPSVPGARVVPVDTTTGEILEQRNPDGDGGRVIGRQAPAVQEDDGLEPEGLTDPELMAAVERWERAVEAADAAGVRFTASNLRGKTAEEIHGYAKRLEDAIAKAGAPR